MFIHVADFMILFLARARFPKSKSIVEKLRSRYSENTVKRIRKLKKLDYHLRKAELYLQFLCKCHDTNVIPNFLIFYLANGHLKHSPTYRVCQLILLIEEICLKKSTLRSYRKNLVLSKCLYRMSFI